MTTSLREIEAQLLARCYALILSWPDPSREEATADPDDFGEQTGPAADATELGGSARSDSTITTGVQDGE